MLYITTKDQKDAHTAYKTLVSDCAADGGLYIPFRIPQYSDEEIVQMKTRSFGDVVAQILNYFFSSKLTGWDVDFAIGRTPVKTVPVGRRIVVSEVWHNPEASYLALEKSIFRKLSHNDGIAALPTDWAKVAIRISVLFGIYADMRRSEILTCGQSFDLAMDVGDFFAPIAAHYAKIMGLPLRKIICCCNGDSAAIWDLIHRNELSTATLNLKIRLGLERLLYVVYGGEELARFTEACENKRVYSVSEEASVRLSDTMFCAVVGKERLHAVINSVYRTDNYLIDSDTALPFGAIQDYRSKVGESTVTLLFAEKDPAASVETILKATGMGRDAFYKLIK